MTMFILHIGVRRALAVLLLALMATAGVQATPPHPSVQQLAAAAQIAQPYFMEHLAELHAKGVGAPDDFLKNNVAAKTADGRSPAFTGTFRILAILVQFTDHPSSVGATFFDSLVFDSLGHTVKDFFHEISYGQLDLVTVNLPSSMGWQTAPQTYAYYVNGQQGLGNYPHNSQKLVEDLVDAVDPVVNFANYDNDGNGYVDVLLVIHSGSGAELTGSNNDIWSHKWAISPRQKDGKYISSYTIQPEYWHNPGDMTIGVYSHELSHGFGLPDLYDTDGSSWGVGKWCLMGYGCWNGATGMGESPSHPCAWARAQMGFVTPVNVLSNLTAQAIPDVEQNAVVYRLWTSGSVGNEYFLVENRQQVGYDTYLKGSGLLIWHIDESKANNDAEWYPGQPASSHFKVALEQADGLFELEHKLSTANAGDIYPGTTAATAFNAVTTPNSNAYSGANSFVAVSNISASSLIMHADLIVGFAAGTDTGDDVLLPFSADLSQNYPNPFNPSTSIRFTLSSAAETRLEVFNVLGQKVRTLVDGRRAAGTVTLTWDAKDDYGNDVPSGVYLYKLVAGTQTLSRKMVLIR
ncbi:MAG TPA: M6 family metalloprotease domain-containing protein [Candidatus Acidoferrum sp.]|nr:M6 family metalloprotease domain-containing protein [Candidatus Acidoferrum sp.]